MVEGFARGGGAPVYSPFCPQGPKTNNTARLITVSTTAQQPPEGGIDPSNKTAVRCERPNEGALYGTEQIQTSSVYCVVFCCVLLCLV